jgi:hypothetical protein
MKKVILLLLLITQAGCEQIEKDKCLDGGGRWNHEKSRCEHK